MVQVEILRSPDLQGQINDFILKAWPNIEIIDIKFVLIIGGSVVSGPFSYSAMIIYKNL
jgi:hypothetical protein